MGNDATSQQPIRNHRDLVAWQVAVDLGMKIYEVSKAWPKDELYGLTSQSRRAAVSVAANIAEGNGRKSTREYLHFLSNAYGSLMEVDTHVEFARRCGYLPDNHVAQINELVTRCDKLLSGLKKSLSQKLKSPPPASHLQPPP
jgi:four helix bundle protein